jgi:hypothetical protein
MVEDRPGVQIQSVPSQTVLPRSLQRANGGLDFPAQMASGEVRRLAVGVSDELLAYRGTEFDQSSRYGEAISDSSRKTRIRERA